MSKTLEATCTAGVVLVGGLPVPGATVFSEGIAESEGVVLLDEDKAFYLPKTTPDLKTTLDNLVNVLSQLETAINTIGDTFTAVGAGMVGSSTAPPPTLPASVTSIKATATAIDAIKTTLTTLKGALK
jgi:hypothetical protein